MTRETVAATLMIWLIGAIVGWCAGWAGRGEQNRTWHHNLVGQLAETRAELSEALEQLDDAHAQLDDVRARWAPAPAPAVVHVHLPSISPGVPQQPLGAAPVRALDAMPARPADGVEP